MKGAAQILVLTGIVAAAGCGSWAKAKRKDTVESYVRFIEAHPESAKLAKAQLRLAEARWAAAEEGGVAAGYAAYVRHHPDGGRIGEARSREAELGYQEAVRDGRQALESYLVHHTEGEFAERARAALEDLIWEAAQAENTAKSYGAYLVRHPEGRYRDEARKKRDDVIYAGVVEENNLFGYRNYIERYPAGGHHDQARAAIAKMTVERMKVVVLLRNTWRPSRASALGRIQSQVSKGVVPRFREAEFPVTVRGRDLTKADWNTHPFDLYPTDDPDVGLLVVDVVEQRGEPIGKGHATRITANMSVYAPDQRVPIYTEEVRAVTSPYVETKTQANLYLNAELALRENFASAALPVGDFKRAAEGG